MKYTLIALLALAGCKLDVNERATSWSGIEPGPRSCAWQDTKYNSDPKTGTCIAKGKAYLCVYEPGENHVECALSGQKAVLPEAP